VAAAQHAQFLPTYDGEGKAMKYTHTITYEFVLEDGQ
jgi:hypothetical protein